MPEGVGGRAVQVPADPAKGCPAASVAEMASRYGPAADLARPEADAIPVAGSRLGNLDVPYDKHWGDGTKTWLIPIDVDPRHPGVTRPLALGIVSELRPAPENLAEGLAARATRAREATRRSSAPGSWRRQRRSSRAR